MSQKTPHDTMSHKSYDGRNQSSADGIDEQKIRARERQTSNQKLLEALNKRKTSHETAYADAMQDAQGGAAALENAQVATQALAKSITNAEKAKTRAEEIAEALRTLVHQASEAAHAVCHAVSATEEFEDEVQEVVAKNDKNYITPRIVAGAAQAEAAAKSALAAIQTALQASVRAYVEAVKASCASLEPLASGRKLLKIFLPNQKAGTDDDKKLLAVAKLDLLEGESAPNSYASVVQDPGFDKRGLLYLIDVVKLVTESRRDVRATAKTGVDLDLGATQQQLAEAKRNVEALDAAGAAAKAAGTYTK
jgi:hypothetical protein